jgi:hypothetical protein
MKDWKLMRMMKNCMESILLGSIHAMPGAVIEIVACTEGERESLDDIK